MSRLGRDSADTGCLRTLLTVRVTGVGCGCAVRGLWWLSKRLVGVGGVEVPGADERVAGEHRDPDCRLGARRPAVACNGRRRGPAAGCGWRRAAADRDGAAGANVGAVGLDLAGQGRSAGRACHGRGEHGRWGAPAQGAVRTSGVAVLGEDRQIAVERVQRRLTAAAGHAGAQPRLTAPGAGCDAHQQPGVIIGRRRACHRSANTALLGQCHWVQSDCHISGAASGRAARRYPRARSACSTCRSSAC